MLKNRKLLKVRHYLIKGQSLKIPTPPCYKNVFISELLKTSKIRFLYVPKILISFYMIAVLNIAFQNSPFGFGFLARGCLEIHYILVWFWAGDSATPHAFTAKSHRSRVHIMTIPKQKRKPKSWFFQRNTLVYPALMLVKNKTPSTVRYTYGSKTICKNRIFLSFLQFYFETSIFVHFFFLVEVST